MTKEQENFDNLNTFINLNQLEKKVGYTKFNATVVIKIQTQSNTFDTDVQIIFEGFNNLGTITFLETTIDSRKYPTEFLVKFQNMKLIKNKDLLITGKHPTLGKYAVTVIPH